MLQLDKSTITKIVGTLIGAKLVQEGSEGEAGPAGGRKPVSLTIKEGFGCFLGLEVQTERYQACLIDPMGGIIASHTELVDFSHKDIRSIILEAVSESKRRFEKIHAPLLGIGVGLAGIIDSDRGIIQGSIPLSVHESMDIVGSLGPLLAIPLKLENDARCCCWGELVRKRFSTPDDFLFLLGEFRKEASGDALPGGIGVGMAFVINDTVYRGKDGSAGEFRSVFRSSPTKSQFSLPDSVVRSAETSSGNFELVARELGKNVGLLVNLLDLRRIVVGGAFERKEGIRHVILEEVLANSAYPDGNRCEIALSELGDLAVAYGAAAMLLNRLFSEPPRSR